jgi:hypothetical protein
MVRLGDRDYPKTANRLGASTIVWLNCVQVDGHNYWFTKVLRLNNLLDQRGRRVCKIMHIMSMKVVLVCHSCASCPSTPRVHIAASIFLATAILRIYAYRNLQIRYSNQRHSVERGWRVRPLSFLRLLDCPHSATWSAAGFFGEAVDRAHSASVVGFVAQ